MTNTPADRRIEHWLVRAARKADHSASENLEFGDERRARELWPRVTRAFGLTDDELVAAVAQYFRLGVADMGAAESRVVRLVPEALARRHGIFPLRENDRQMFIATADPTDNDAEQAVGFVTGRMAVLQVAAPSAIEHAIQSSYSSDRPLELLMDRVDAEVAFELKVIDESRRDVAIDTDADSAPIIKLANLIVRDAIEQRASDIHIEPQGSGGVVRFRVDGVLRPYLALPGPALTRITARIKILSRLDIADRLRPQDGKMRVELQGTTYDLRVSTVPASDAEKVVIRVLRPNTATGLSDLQLPADDQQRVLQFLANRDGIVLVTGPTGSGKTTTLYAALRQVAKGEVNVMTVEDPVEYQIAGITQVQVDTKRGVTFASALRSLLRQDPDIIFVGEIRDNETAAVAVQASLTGHLVLATLHTNDAAGVVPRLVELGMQPTVIASALRGALAQRLVRRVCTHCAQPVPQALSADETRLANAFGVRPVVRAVGCRHCAESGYLGRIPIVEVLANSGPVQQAIADGAGPQQVRELAIARGMNTLRDAALERVRRGETTLQEVERVIGDAGASDGEKNEAPRFLVADDDGVTRRLTRALLERNGWHVTEAADGLEALAHLNGPHNFSLLVLDLAMPNVDGREVLRTIKKSMQNNGLPVLVLTGSGDPDEEITLMEQGADDYIRKPLDAARFIGRVKAVLRRSGRLPEASMDVSL